MKTIIVAIILCVACFGCATQPKINLIRRYHEGETLKYYYFARSFSGANPINRWEEARATAIVAKEPSGAHHEEWEWNYMNKDGKRLAIPPGYRQWLSLDPLSKGSFSLPPASIMNGATTDTMNYYVNILFAIKSGSLRKPGDRVYLSRSIAPSWGGAGTAIFGQDCLDWDITLVSVDGRYASLRVINVPPPKSCSNPVPAAWMLERVFDTPNNWFQISKEKDGSFLAAVGKEIIDTTLQMDLETGKILAAHMHNPVRTQQRRCTDAAAQHCESESKTDSFVREVVLLLEK